MHCRALVLLASVACACAREGAQQATGDSTVPRAIDVPDVLTITASDYAFSAPPSIKSGWTTFRLMNNGGQIHSAQLVKLEEGHSLAEFVTAYEHAWRAVGPRPKWGRRVGGPGAAEPNSSTNATMYLEPGQYGWYCPMNVEDGVPHVFSKGMSRAFVVEPRTDTNPQTAPQATVVVSLSDYAFKLSAPLTAGRHVIKLENKGVEPHELGLIKLNAGKTLKDFEAWSKDFQGPPPGTIVGGVNALATNAEAYFDVDLTPGNYLLICFVTAPDGRSHVQHGMIQAVSIE